MATGQDKTHLHTGSWNPSEKWLTSRERFEEMLVLLKQGDCKVVEGLLEDILNEMDNA